ncbi:hypothetical protein LEP1GSC103_2655 [Leptospira borgpetersenii serovar Javanica str. UI 09931]|uniref:Aminotransferase, class I/II domain protein n=2 Tax=Leptospira borgpetersenii TaxID=174 RepID=A0AAV3JF61_LEPBO|nr:hypothetical protein C4Q31_00755 [Leptospira borgpetersenii serovar Ceylonica]EKQ91828.1 hypothetical protein LEP1GSC101_3001 [Leptospira borgpetersenii str. UI 09149]EMK09304.1 hypothetical protein LEP1GSC066_1585 [Leptospira sp. serovar Kenya str. Sh9]EMN13716.1 hypothetical protein LEP1GSC055_3836 [Leptospira borgpetersenii str. Brem 307]EMN17852.1 hypothetical protein LEP1GSC056_2904 [Leptospira borgpetersenii str. Brem 328]EMN59337.1 hypothetical protein LEP1GSC090_1600 [Leptospira bor
MKKAGIINVDSPRLFYSAFPNPSLLCQKDQAARFCPSFGTEPYIEFTLIIVPGETFFPGTDPNGSHRQECFRLSFVRESKEIEKGILRIGLEKFSK